MFPINRNRPRPSTICFLLTLCLTAWSAFGRPSPQPTPTQAAVSNPAQPINASTAKPKSRIKPICEAQLGERTLGKNPLREQVETIEPDPETWRKISLEMQKEDGLRLSIELLRSLDWIANYEAIAGQTIFIDLEEMGAVGEAEVTAIEPCPPIQRGSGGIVTGIFKHESDGKNVVLLTIEGEAKPTTVTGNHLYWSADRHSYIPVGELCHGERLETEFGDHRVVSVTPHPNYTGLLYNVETTEHVYEIGELGVLVHNACQLIRYGDGGGHHIFAKRAFEGNPGYSVGDALAISNAELQRLNLKHLGSDSITTTQQRLFRELAASGRPNTLAEHARIAREVLIEHGVDPKDAASVVQRAMNQLKAWGITAPSSIPWGGS